MKPLIYYERISEKYKEKIKRKEERRLRDIERGVIKGKIYERTLSNGKKVSHIVTWEPKGIQHWYSTRELVDRVSVIFNRNEKVSGRRECHINGRWQLQIRGKHLRRLLKAMPSVKQVGRMLVDTKNGEK